MSVSLDKNCTFSSERLNFRGISKNDTDLLVLWRSSEEVFRYFLNPKPITREEHLAWFSKYMQRPDELRVIFTEKESNTDIGVVGGRCLETGVCELDSYTGNVSFRNKGYMREAFQAFMDYVHANAGICTFDAHIHRDNLPCIKCITNVGFLAHDDSKDTILFRRNDFAGKKHE